MTITSLDELFEHELKDLYDAEKKLTRALPKVAKGAGSEELRAAIEAHLEATKTQVGRLEAIFKLRDIKPQAKTCAGMKGLIEEADELIEAKAGPGYGDLAIIGGARRVEHYEIAAYSSLQSIAESLGDGEAVSLIQETLREEEEADRKLAEIADSILEELRDEAEEETGEEIEEEDEEEFEPISKDERVPAGGRKR